MAKNWVIVADRSLARIFTNESPAGQLEEVETLRHPEGRLRTRAIDADRPGRSFQSAGKMRHGMEREIDAKKQKAITFAHRVAERLENARLHGEMERLVLAAPPEFLGFLREALSTETRRMIQHELPLDLVGMAPKDIRRHLPEKLFFTVTAR
jgi:protein required for attachment to host cells